MRKKYMDLILEFNNVWDYYSNNHDLELEEYGILEDKLETLENEIFELEKALGIYQTNHSVFMTEIYSSLKK